MIIHQIMSTPGHPWSGVCGALDRHKADPSHTRAYARPRTAAVPRTAMPFAARPLSIQPVGLGRRWSVRERSP